MITPAWEGYDPDSADEADATIVLPDGTRRYATFMTIDTIARVMARWSASGECLNGGYFWCSDLIIIREPGFQAMTEAIRDLISTGEITTACGELQDGA